MRYPILLCLLSIPALLAQSKRGVTAEDYYRFQSVADPHFSPSGKQVAYVVTKVDEKRSGRESSVWLAESDGMSPPRRFASTATSPR